MDFRQKEKMNFVYTAFEPYIKEHTAFDIVYSEKLGYVKLYANAEWENEAIRFQTWQELLESLCHEIILDVITVSPKDTKAEQIFERSFRCVEESLNHAGAASEDLLVFAEQFIQEFLLREEKR